MGGEVKERGLVGWRMQSVKSEEYVATGEGRWWVFGVEARRDEHRASV